jgi:hypothetical protein
VQPNTSTPVEKIVEVSRDVNVSRFNHTPQANADIEPQVEKVCLNLKHFASIRDVEPLSPEDN